MSVTYRHSMFHLTECIHSNNLKYGKMFFTITLHNICPVNICNMVVAETNVFVGGDFTIIFRHGLSFFLCYFPFL